MSKKIALLHYAYPPKIGGVEVLLSEQAKILTELGHEVSILTGSGEEIKSEIKLHVIPELHSVLTTDPKLQEKIVNQGIIDDNFYSLAKRIEEQVKPILDKQDVIIVHNMLTLIHNLPFIYFFKRYATNLTEKKVLVWAHDQTFIDQEKILNHKEGVKLNDLAKDLLLTPLSNATYIAISETFKKLFCRVTGLSTDKVRVIPDGINLKKFLEIDDTIWNFTREKDLLNKFPIVLSPVNILPRKNLEFSLEIVKELKKNFPSILYLITGQPSTHRSTKQYYETIIRKIKELQLEENVFIFSDYLKRLLTGSEMHDLYSLSDLVLYFSKSENFGLPILEASLSKTPIFVSNLEVFHEIASSNVQYVDYATSPPQKVAELIKDYLDNDPRIKSHYNARSKYDLKTILQEKLIPLF